jgi:hypothetical protein
MRAAGAAGNQMVPGHVTCQPGALNGPRPNAYNGLVAAISVGRDDAENEHDAHTESAPIRRRYRLSARVPQQLGVRCLDLGIAYARVGTASRVTHSVTVQTSSGDSGLLRTFPTLREV